LDVDITALFGGPGRAKPKDTDELLTLYVQLSPEQQAQILRFARRLLGL
jgi:hypothetical protein